MECSLIFKPTRGVRQGDPLSPYLSVLGMERLGHLIKTAYDSGSWKPLFLSRRGPGISHLFFTDHLILFCKANRKNVLCLQQVLQSFCLFFGHRVNYKETKVFFSNNVHNNVSEMLCTILGYTKMDDLGIYLGVTLFHNRVGIETFQLILDKVLQRLNGWEATKLSLAGRLTLVKSVLLAIPNYFMSMDKILIYLYNFVGFL